MLEEKTDELISDTVRRWHRTLAGKPMESVRYSEPSHTGRTNESITADSSEVVIDTRDSSEGPRGSRITPIRQNTASSLEVESGKNRPRGPAEGKRKKKEDKQTRREEKQKRREERVKKRERKELNNKEKGPKRDFGAAQLSSSPVDAGLLHMRPQPAISSVEEAFSAEMFAEEARKVSDLPADSRATGFVPLVADDDEPICPKKAARFSFIPGDKVLSVTPLPRWDPSERHEYGDGKQSQSLGADRGVFNEDAFLSSISRRRHT